MGVSSTAAAMLCTTGTTKSHPGRTGSVSAGALQTRAEGVADYWKYSKAMTARKSGTAHAKLNGNLAADMKRRASGSTMPE
ncbi:hypothetical protein EMIHUDRAFT_439589 [Emiliania huxleyi CCMP1516]|uniref:Uncharacterized protein n=2 Tax=Emiliania huxleyi TaxID=2903 RepID=A0A0D3KYA0_EMIH1|nr:hypothetical protein EMIHUDRAFT_424130 [Emiliania huxleyi CCMP1516]XP_005793164.1 hypothetical protein EMIHUDRAFT_439589 [Emiliania huxleyi CCMP1516]EOD28253.1 hypothetical protein EMIHUDRAFT_424130 [Emiliania huxleyi CCMP1516]EOD40735.1 hypothetical protein EMIHUDRAFT_439589 [Emiliania huxleyi CCMP1516]|eukprot:XP_005780682.1 hypothetical protein EMIHUDRAFT_424130 [Emiliania huxleyi CCMP1516]